MTLYLPRNPLIRTLRLLSSLRLTVALMAAAMVLIFLATWDQKDIGIQEVVQIYFRQWISYFDIRTGGGWDATLKVVVPPKPVFRVWLPGGYLIGAVFLVNLIAAHAVRFRFGWKKAGITVIHAGIILILLGELFTGIKARETHMTIDEGATVNYSQSSQRTELAFVDRTDPQREKHVVIPQSRLRVGEQFSPPELPFRVEVLDFLSNASLGAIAEAGDGRLWKPTGADQGVGRVLQVAPMDRAKQMNEINLPYALIRVHEGNHVLGTWAVSGQLDLQKIDQRIPSADGRTWDVALRAERSYKPFSLTLRDFRHDVYPGTDIPKDFSSFVTMTEKGMEKGRDFRIWMNHPLRHGGYTFYQASFKNNNSTTVLQVVKNPSWLIPYIACVMVFSGLVLQFGLSLATHLSKRRDKAA